VIQGEIARDLARFGWVCSKCGARPERTTPETYSDLSQLVIYCERGHYVGVESDSIWNRAAFNRALNQVLNNRRQHMRKQSSKRKKVERDVTVSIRASIETEVSATIVVPTEIEVDPEEDAEEDVEALLFDTAKNMIPKLLRRNGIASLKWFQSESKQPVDPSLLDEVDLDDMELSVEGDDA